MRTHCSLALTTLLLISCSPAQSGQSPDVSSHSSVAAQPKNSFDTVPLFGFGDASNEPLPAPGPGEVVIRYGGWSMNELRGTKLGQQYLKYYDESYAKDAWANKKLPAGIYHLKPLLASTDSGSFVVGQPVPAVLLATALIAYKMEQGSAYNVAQPEDPFTATVDVSHCATNKRPKDLIGMYGDGEGGLLLEKDYCYVLGGGVWEAKL